MHSVWLRVCSMTEHPVNTTPEISMLQAWQIYDATTQELVSQLLTLTQDAGQDAGQERYVTAALAPAAHSLPLGMRHCRSTDSLEVWQTVTIAGLQALQAHRLDPARVSRKRQLRHNVAGSTSAQESCSLHPIRSAHWYSRVYRQSTPRQHSICSTDRGCET